MNFIDLGLSEPILDGLRDVGFSSPTKIQWESIIPVLNGHDIIASSETGTGKTGAFVIPILEKLSKNPQAGVRCLILTPTRELANQIDEQVTVIGYYSGITSATVFGGTDGSEFGVQERALRTDGANIIIATPGRLLDHIKMGYVDFSKVEFLVLDEADRMLDMGFIPDVKKIVATLPEKKQNILFSATIPDTLDYFFKALTNNAVRVDCSVARTASGVTQTAIKVSEELRDKTLLDVLQTEGASSVIVFTRTKRDADHVYKFLSKSGLSVGVIHGDREQAEREVTLAGFKNGTITVIVATDVLARGIDVDDVSHVVNYQVPGEPEDYIHRIGRTGRAEAKGTAVTLVSPREVRGFNRIKQHVKTPIEERFTNVDNQSESVQALFSGMNEPSSGGKKQGKNGKRKSAAHHHSGETSSDLEASKALLLQGLESIQDATHKETKHHIRTSTTTRKPGSDKPTYGKDDESTAQETKSNKPESTVISTVNIEETTAESVEAVNKRKKKRPKKKKPTEGTAEPKGSVESVVSQKEASQKHRKAIVLTKREELQKRFDAVENEPVGFFNKLLRFFGLGKNKK